MKTCLGCGERFEEKNLIQLYCSRRCKDSNRDINRELLQPRLCRKCGAEFKPDKRYQKYCTKKCRESANYTPVLQRKKREGRPAEAVHPKNCIRCGKEFMAKLPYQKWCSPHCKALARQSAVNPNHLSREERQIVNKCKMCGKEYQTTLSRINRVFCSQACQLEWMRLEFDTRAGENRRARILRNGKPDIGITLAKVIKRDKGICHICGMKVDLAANILDKKAPVVDHIFPIARGGTHTWDNVALAHRECNGKKWCSESFESPNGQLRWSF